MDGFRDNSKTKIKTSVTEFELQQLHEHQSNWDYLFLWLTKHVLS
jgi:hypothetical protein